MTVPDAPASQPSPPPVEEPDASEASEASEKKHSTKRQLIEWGLILGGAILVAIVVQAFFIKVFWIPTASMDPMLRVGDRVAVNRMSDNPSRGDIIVFERPTGTAGPKDLIKRVIGMPGDTVEGRAGTVYINNEPLEEPYLTAQASSGVQFSPVTVPAGHYFMMGDNRLQSLDSRIFGPIPQKSIIGKAIVRIWPPTKLTLL